MRPVRPGYGIRRIIVSAAIACVALLVHLTVEAAWFSQGVRDGIYRPGDILCGRINYHGGYFEFLWYATHMSWWHAGWIVVLSGALAYFAFTRKNVRIVSRALGWLIMFAIIRVILFDFVYWLHAAATEPDYWRVYPLNFAVNSTAVAAMFFVMWQLFRDLAAGNVLSRKTVCMWSALWLLSATVAIFLPIAPRGGLVWDWPMIPAYSVSGLVAGMFWGWGSATEAESSTAVPVCSAKG